MWTPFVKNAKSVKGASQSTTSSTQMHLKIAEIRDNTVVLKNGGIRAVLKTTPINFNLKSEEEKNSIIYSYQNFLNSLEFPIQIVVRSRKLDLDKYIEDMQKTAAAQENTLLQRQTYEYIDFINKLIEYADIMEKEFYVVIPMDPIRAQKKSFIQGFFERMNQKDTVGNIMKRHREFDELRKKLAQRVNIGMSGLENCGMKVEELGTNQLINLYYQIYNPITSRYEKLEDPEELTLASEASLGRG